MHLNSEIRRFDSFPWHRGVNGILMYGIGREGDQSLLYVYDDYVIVFFPLHELPNSNSNINGDPTAQY